MRIFQIQKEREGERGGRGKGERKGVKRKEKRRERPFFCRLLKHAKKIGEIMSFESPASPIRESREKSTDTYISLQ